MPLFTVFLEEGIEVSGAEKRLERHELHRPTNGMFAQAGEAGGRKIGVA